METDVLLVVLSLGTMLIVIGLALWSKRATENRRKDPDAPKSTLAEDGPESRRG